jgi:hypothetical protein
MEDHNSSTIDLRLDPGEKPGIARDATIGALNGAAATDDNVWNP